jgi:UDP-N-acetylmuramoyl-tripeptide--D-alanyl-D-alanine ligase
VIPLRIDHIAEAVQGVVHGIDGATLVRSVVTDSREPMTDAMFVAIVGERVDGHTFAPDVMARGACVVLSDRVLSEPCIQVSDTVAALGLLAKWYHRTQLQCTVIAITGSSGKTTTKDLIHQVCEQAGPTVSAQGSFNTDVGLPLTVLKADAATRYLVLEMGMRGMGHIARLVDIVTPDIGVVLNVGSAHIELLGSQQAIANAKGELVRDLAADAWAVLNNDDPFVRKMPTNAQRWLFGESAGSDVMAQHIRLDDQARPSFDLVIQDHRAHVQLALHGEHYVSNALAAASVGSLIGLDAEQIATALSNAQAKSRWRMEIQQTKAGFRVVNDAYNANPESVRAALKALIAMRGGGRAWAVLGEMRELGATARDEHDAIGRLIVRLDVDQLICIGAATKVMYLGASNEGSWGDEAAWAEDPDAAYAMLAAGVQPKDVVLVKASRSIGLDVLAHRLVHELGGGAA